MKIALLKGSPKHGWSASGVILRELQAAIPGECSWVEHHLMPGTLTEETLAELASCSVLVLAFPLYMDGVPGHLVKQLQVLEQFLVGETQDIVVYAMVNNGFIEGRQADLALAMIGHWCRRAGLAFDGGFDIGAGGMRSSMDTVPPGSGPKKSLGRAYAALGAAIAHRCPVEIMFTGPVFPRWAYMVAADHSWRRTARANGLKARELGRRP